MTKIAIICNTAQHIRTILNLNPNDPRILVITPHDLSRVYGNKDIYYYEIRPMYFDEAKYAEYHGWKSINKTELYDLLEVNR